MKYRVDTDYVLKGLSFSIKPNEKIGVIGRTGAGKSSLI
jgi:ABC-type multidrug transport system fused ATPase/permease subunit